MKSNKILSKSGLRQLLKSKELRDKKIVLVSGSWDMLHVGHMRYLYNARLQGDVLIVGIDSDKKIKKRKGEHRPVVPENERAEMLSYLRMVDYIYIKPHSAPANELIKLVRPDVLVVSKTTSHSKDALQEKKQFCGRMVILPPQAETSTTARIRKLHIDGQKEFVKRLNKLIDKLLDDMLNQY